MANENQTNVAEQIQPELPFDMDHLKSLKTVSAQIRYLDKCGLKKGPIAKVLTAVRGKTTLYQHVRNVLVTPVKVAPRD